MVGQASIPSTANIGYSSTLDVLVVRTDENGNIVWINSFGGPGSDFGAAIIENAKGGYALTGSSEFANLFRSDMLLMVLDENGN